MATVRKFWTMGPGSAKTSLWPTYSLSTTVWTPTGAEVQQIMALVGVEEVSREGTQKFKVVVVAPSVEQLVAILPTVRSALQKIVDRYHPAV